MLISTDYLLNLIIKYDEIFSHIFIFWNIFN